MFLGFCDSLSHKNALITKNVYFGIAISTFSLSVLLLNVWTANTFKTTTMDKIKASRIRQDQKTFVSFGLIFYHQWQKTISGRENGNWAVSTWFCDFLNNSQDLKSFNNLTDNHMQCPLLLQSRTKHCGQIHEI